VGGTLQMTATPLDNTNQPIQGKTVNWTSTNPAAATVSASGLVTALTPGNTQIIAEADGRTSSLQVQVTLVPVGSVTLSPSLDTMAVNDNRQYIPVVRDTAGRVINSLAGRSVSWTSSNVLNATVNAQGVVIAVGKGASTITVTVDQQPSNDIALTVSEVASVTITPSPATVKLGATTQLTVTPKDALGNVLRWGRPLTTFTSSNSSIATVSSTGVVSGLTQGGPVTLTLGINGVNATVAVSVVP
jgi:trimeric autotransporter adhesin